MVDLTTLLTIPLTGPLTEAADDQVLTVGTFADKLGTFWGHDTVLDGGFGSVDPLTAVWDKGAGTEIVTFETQSWFTLNTVLAVKAIRTSVANEGWEEWEIGGVTFLRSDFTFTGGNLWRLEMQTNPFGTTEDDTRGINWKRLN